MATLNIGDRLKVTVVCSAGSQFSQNVLHYVILSSTGAGPRDDLIADPLSAAMADRYKPLLCAGARYEGLKLQRVDPTPTQPFVTTFEAGVGTVLGDLLPPQTCGLIKKKSSVAGPTGRGRIYIPFPGEASCTSAGFVHADYTIELEAFGTDLLVNNIVLTYTGGTATISCHLAKPPYDSPSVKDITAYVASARWATQRRRSFVNRGDTNPLS